MFFGDNRRVMILT